jgi:hypothetical protein
MSSPRPDFRARLGLLLAALGLGLAVVAPASPAEAQTRPVVYNEVNVSGQGAGITLEFEGGERLTLELREGTVRIDGTETGRYTPGGTLDRAWRELLAGAIATDNGGVARLLAAWDPPSGLEGDAAAAARTLGDRLRGALTAAPGQTGGATGAAGGVVGSLDPDARQSVLQLILENPDRAREIALLLADQAMHRSISGSGATFASEPTSASRAPSSWWTATWNSWARSRAT